MINNDLIKAVICSLVISLSFGFASKDFADGSPNEEIILGNGATLDITGAISMFVWANHDTSGGGNQEKYMSKSDPAETNVSNYSFSNDPSDNHLQFDFNINGNWHCWETTGAVTSDGVWDYYAVTFDNAQGVQFYDNGATSADSRTCGSGDAPLPTNAADTVIGGQDANTSAGMDGELAGAMAFERELAGWEVKEIQYAPSRIVDSLVFFHMLWDFIDLSGNGLTGTDSGTTTSSDGPPVMFGSGLPL